MKKIFTLLQTSIIIFILGLSSHQTFAQYDLISENEIILDGSVIIGLTGELPPYVEIPSNVLGTTIT